LQLFRCYFLRPFKPKRQTKNPLEQHSQRILFLYKISI